MEDAIAEALTADLSLVTPSLEPQASLNFHLCKIRLVTTSVSGGCAWHTEVLIVMIKVFFCCCCKVGIEVSV